MYICPIHLSLPLYLSHTDTQTHTCQFAVCVCVCTDGGYSILVATVKDLTPAPFSPQKMRRLNPYATRHHVPENSQYSLS